MRETVKVLFKVLLFFIACVAVNYFWPGIREWWPAFLLLWVYGVHASEKAQQLKQIADSLESIQAKMYLLEEMNSRLTGIDEALRSRRDTHFDKPSPW